MALVNNRLWDTGSTSHTVEIDYGLRSCDGQPGAPGRELCRRYLDAGAWGTIRIDDGTNQVRIPNLNVTLAGNVIANPRVQGDEVLNIAAPFSASSQQGSGLGAVRADAGLRIYRNLFAVGRSLPDRTDGCRAADCAALRSRNVIGNPSDPYRDPGHGDLTLRRRWAPVAVPRLDWTALLAGS